MDRLGARKLGRLSFSERIYRDAAICDSFRLRREMAAIPNIRTAIVPAGSGTALMPVKLKLMTFDMLSTLLSAKISIVFSPTRPVSERFKFSK